jgi:hypothetical protein
MTCVSHFARLYCRGSLLQSSAESCKLCMLDSLLQRFVESAKIMMWTFMSTRAACPAWVGCAWIYWLLDVLVE